VRESAHRFGRNGPLVGVLTPAQGSAPSRPAVLLLNSGIVHRVGPNRAYVTIARRLAARGFPALRFDFSGLGDSPPRADHQPMIRSCVEETAAAMDLVQSETGGDRFVLLGICSGADAALLTAAQDHRVAGVLAINARRYGAAEDILPEVRQLALARHYRRIATSRSFGAHSISRFSRGKLEWKDVLRALRSQLPKLFARRGFASGAHGLGPLLKRGIPVYCLHSEADEGLDHLHVLAGKRLQELCSQTGFRLEVLEGADHTFTMRWSRIELFGRLEKWLEETFEAVDETEGRADGGS
jgi:pimeloyl-ACP methyl ester carboxylesterase